LLRSTHSSGSSCAACTCLTLPFTFSFNSAISTPQRQQDTPLAARLALSLAGF
jgi:hypothetical protein